MKVKKLKISRKINIFKNIFEKFQFSSSNEGQKHNSKLSKWKSWVFCTGITPFQVVNNYCIRMQFQSSHQASHMIRQNVCTWCLNNKSQFLTKCISGHSGWKCSNSFFLSSQGLYIIYQGVNFCIMILLPAS